MTHGLAAVKIECGKVTAVCECGWESKPVKEGQEPKARGEQTKHAEGASK